MPLTRNTQHWALGGRTAAAAARNLHAPFRRCCWFVPSTPVRLVFCFLPKFELLRPLRDTHKKQTPVRSNSNNKENGCRNHLRWGERWVPGRVYFRQSISKVASRITVTTLVCVHAVVTFRMLRPTRHIKAGTLLTQLKKNPGGERVDG